MFIQFAYFCPYEYKEKIIYSPFTPMICADTVIVEKMYFSSTKM